MNIEQGIFLVAREALSLDQATVLEDKEHYRLIDDPKAGVFYICLGDQECDLPFLLHEARKKEETVCVISLTDIEVPISDEFHRFQKVRQFTYHGPRFSINAPYKIEKMGLQDLDYLAAHYTRIGDDDSYFRGALDRGMLKAVSEEGEIMAFIGEHPEHAMGMLYVDENHRRKGIGTVLEKALINKFLDEGKVPFDHVVLDNYKSMNLQRSLGMTLDEGFLYWYF